MTPEEKIDLLIQSSKLSNMVYDYTDTGDPAIDLAARKGPQHELLSSGSIQRNRRTS